MIRTMRTTLDLDDDILQAAKELAAMEGTTAGRIVSDLVRKALTPSSTTRMRNGVPLLSRSTKRVRPITMARVNRLRDD
jgi:hypothetical protein